jgi:hypothetical protein
MLSGMELPQAVEKKTKKYICRHCGNVFCDHTGTFYYDLHKEEHIIIDLALRMAMKGMS